MLNTHFPYPLYLVVSEKDCIHYPILDVIEQSIQGGVSIVQLREKNSTDDSYLLKAQLVKQLCDHYKVPLIVNDNVQVAIAVGAWGVHVGNSDMKPSEIVKLANAPLHIGWSIESIDQLSSAEMQHVHHLGVSPVFSTPTKTNTVTEWGTNGLQQLRKVTQVPLVAIGGIHHTNIQDVVRAGANSIAVVSAICGSKDPFGSTIQLKKLINDLL